MSRSSWLEEHVCDPDDFEVNHGHTMCSKCGLIQNCIYDSRENNVTEWYDQDSHVCPVDNNEFFTNQTLSVPRPGKWGTGRVSYGSYGTPNIAYKDKVLYFNFRVIETIASVMQLTSNIEHITKRLMCVIIRNSAIKQNRARYVCNFVCMFMAMRKSGMVVELDDIIEKFGLHEKETHSVTQMCLKTLTTEYIPQLTEEEYITLYLRRILMDGRRELHASATKIAAELDLLYGRICPLQSKIQMAVVGALFANGVKSPYELAPVMFKKKLFAFKGIVKGLTDVVAIKLNPIKPDKESRQKGTSNKPKNKAPTRQNRSKPVVAI